MSIAPDGPALRRARPRLVVLALLIAVAALQLEAGLGPPRPVQPSGVAGALPARSSPATEGQAPATPASTLGPADSPVGIPDPGVGTDGRPAAGLAGGPSPAMLELLDSHLETLRARHGIPGISATVLFRDGSRWSGAAGLADVANRVVVRPGTPFSIASISKTFTAALILQLAAEGRLALTDSAAARLGGSNGIAIDRRITIAQLLDHTSGLRDYFLNARIESALAADPDARWTAARAFAYAGRPLALPGARFYYSNTNYLLLGLIAERLTGQPLGTLLRNRFFDPLGLVTASYQSLDRPFLPLARAYRFRTGSATEAPIPMPGGTDVVPFRAAVTASGGAGSVAAASPDVAAWARALYDGTVLGPAMTAAMIADAARPDAVDPRLPYGYGVHALVVDGRSSLGHSGRYLGARSVVRHFPLEGLTVAVLTNQSRTDPNLVLVDLVRLAVVAQARLVAGDGED